MLPIIVLAILWAVIVGAGYYYSENYFSPQTEFEDIKISHKKSEVRVIKGVPDEEDDDLWVYSEYGMLYVYFQGDSIKAILSNRGTFYPSNFIHKFFSMFGFLPEVFPCGDEPYHGGYLSYDSVLKRFGMPSKNEILNDQITRYVEYDRYNILFVFVKNRISLCGIYNKSLRERGK